MNAPSTILIVDDNPNNLQVLTSILQTGGFKVRPALSGALALRSLESQLPDLILLDVRMPGMDGYEACRQIKARDETRDIPVLFISAMNEVEDKLRAFRVGAVDYITKPFQFEEVLARVRTQMELAMTRKALAESNARLRALMDQLVQTEKLRSLGFLAAGVAHELNTPIGNALLMADTMNTAARQFANADAGGAPRPSAQDMLDTLCEGAPLIVRNLNRAADLIRSLREVSVDRASERRRRVVLRELVEGVLALMGGSLDKTPCRVTVRISAELTLETYPGHLEQIVENLVRNAIIHGFDGAPSGRIEISCQAAGENHVVLMVADNGKGIPEADIKRVFDPFFTTKMGQGGCGLGLHIAYTLATGILGGHIGVASAAGQGAQFSLTLPLVAPSQPD
jgi:signal transduction histidine kinase